MRAPVLLLLLALFAPAPAAAGAEPAAPPAKRQQREKPRPEPARVYTNEDLDRLPPDPAARRSGTASEQRAADEPKGSPPKAVATAEPAQPDPLQRMEDEASRARGIDAQVVEAERRVAEADARVAALERKRLAIRNPYLPRPELTPEEAEAWKGMDNAQRVEAAERELEAARKAAADARSALEALESKR